jgi:TonB family protein
MRALALLPLLFAPIGVADTIRVPLPRATDTSGAWRIAEASVEVPADSVSPILISAPQPAQTNVTSTSLVSVTFQVNEKGFPVNIQVVKSSNKELEDEVIALIREWRFEAALKRGSELSRRHT